MKTQSILSFAGALMLSSSLASAQPNYPQVVKDHLAAVRKPPCKICHENGNTGFGTVTTRFGINMQSNTLQAFDEESVRRALDGMAASGKISADRKSPTDIEVLKAGGDPNDESPIYLIEDPQYGCGGATFAGRVQASWGSSCLAFLGLALALRRSSRARRS